MLSNLSAYVTPSNDEDAIHLISEAHKILKASIISDTTLTKENKKEIGFTLETMLVSCYFDGVKCNVSDFTWSYNYDYGNCYTFNSAYNDQGETKAPRSTTRSGPGTGLIVELFGGTSRKQDFYLATRGFYLQINNRTEMPLIKNSGIHVPLGQYSTVEIRKEVLENLPAPYSDCRKDLTPVSSDSIYYNSYRDLFNSLKK